MAFETGAAGGALIKFFGVPIVAGSAATALTFLFMWPRSKREGCIRLACAIAMSGIAGPLLVVAVHSWWASLFDSAKAVCVLYGLPEELGVVYVSAPLLVIAGLPAWWLLGGLMRWLEKRRDKDIAEIAHDAVEVVRDVRGAL